MINSVISHLTDGSINDNSLTTGNNSSQTVEDNNS